MTAPTPRPGTPDALATVIQVLQSCLPGMWIADVLPPHKEMQKHLPAVRIDLLPGDETVPWGGPGGSVRDRFTLDVDVIAGSRAEATPVAGQVRDLLHALPTMPGTGITFVDCPPMSTRPDINPHVRRLGVDADIHMPTV